MKKYYKSILYNLSFNLLFWIILFTFIFLIRYYDGGDSGFHQLKYEIPAIRIYGNGLLLGILTGIFYSFMEIYLRNKGVYKYSLLRIMINRALIHTSVTFGVLTLGAYINYSYDVSTGIVNPYQNGFTSYLFGATISFLFIGAVLGNIVISIIRTLQMKIGEEIFYPLLTSEFRPSHEEDRTYLFLDLNSSTTIAEKLGHEKYSHFIQDCFSDLHPALIASEAQVYQYVGDEAVLTWETSDAIKNNNCLKVFFEFDKQLDSRKDYYEEKYGVVPEFKGGINGGKVMTAEVGVIKREIAYHSDVLNTAARIQGKCNEHNARLLVSENIKSMLHSTAVYEFESKGEVELRGRQQKVEIFEVKQS